MRLGTVIVQFEKNWQQIYKPLLEQNFDHFEIVPENQEVYTVLELKQYFKGREVIIHAPFAQANLIAPSKHIRQASRKYLSEVLAPLTKEFNPQVITSHLGKIGSFYGPVELDEFLELRKEFPSITFENLPESSTFWSMSYPRNDVQFEHVLSTAQSNITFDVGHWGRQGFDVYSFVEKYGDRIRDIHLHDFKKGKDHLPLGEGELDLRKFFSVLEGIKYSHYVTLELGFEDTNSTIESYKKVQPFFLS